MQLSKKTELYLVFQLLILCSLYFIYLAGGYKSFYLWEQIDVLAGYNPINTIFHPHGLRYLITWPSIGIADYFDWNRDKVFSVFVTINLFACAALTSWVQSRLSKQIERRWIIWFYLYVPIFLTLSFPMNGRLSYMLLGAAAMIFAYHAWIKCILRERPVWNAIPYALLVIVSLVFLSVSSGCFSVGMIVVALHLRVMAILSKNTKDRLLHVGLNLSCLTFFLFLFVSAVSRNLGFYNGSWFAMLMHGPGAILAIINPNKPALSLIIALVVFLLVIMGDWMRQVTQARPYFITSVLMCMVALIIGAFGYSTLLTGSVAALILIAHIGGTVLGTEAPTREVIRRYLREYVQIIKPNKSRLAASGVLAIVTFLLCMQLFPNDWQPYKAVSKLENPAFVLQHIDNGKHASEMQGTFIPEAMTMDPKQNVYIVENGLRIIRVAPGSAPQLLLGSVKGDRDGTAAEATFGYISDIEVNEEGTLFIADKDNHKIKKYGKDGLVKTIAGIGNPGIPTGGCNAVSECLLKSPEHLTLFANGDLLISMAQGNIIVRLDKNGHIFPFVRQQASDIKNPEVP